MSRLPPSFFTRFIRCVYSQLPAADRMEYQMLLKDAIRTALQDTPIFVSPAGMKAFIKLETSEPLTTFDVESIAQEFQREKLASGTDLLHTVN